ncbi:hypothetical protein MKX03_031223 [Papaver bracteatum]|nr:hypothetical protein MKX03_031223 [Papaver bracteatum]
MCSSAEERINIDKQVKLFANAVGMFGHAMAKDTIDKKHPALWWNSYGDSAPELQRVVVRVLSATCSAIGCEINWSIFEQVHTKRRNRLSQKRLNALGYVKYDLQLNERFTKRKEQGDSYDPICLSDMESDDEWITEKDDPTWMDVHYTMKLAQGKGSSKGKDITVVDADEIQEVEEDDIEGDYMEEMEDFERQMQAESDTEWISDDGCDLGA